MSSQRLAPLFGVLVLTLAALVVRARVDQARGDYEAAAGKLEQAVAIQNGLPYTEPPYWYYPVEQTLGAVLLQSGDADGAARAFRNSLVLHPNNAWSLWGLKLAQEAAGDAAAPYTAELYRKAAVRSDGVAVDRL